MPMKKPTKKFVFFLLQTRHRCYRLAVLGSAELATDKARIEH